MREFLIVGNFRMPSLKDGLAFYRRGNTIECNGLIHMDGYDLADKSKWLLFNKAKVRESAFDKAKVGSAFNKAKVAVLSGDRVGFLDSNQE